MTFGADQLTETFISVSDINNQVEAQLLASILTEREIPHRIHSFHDTALDGLYQTLKGWGEITAPPKYKAEILGILDNIRTSPAPETDSSDS